MQVLNFDFDKIPQFSKRDKDYTLKSEEFSDFINVPFEYHEFNKLIQERSEFKTDRNLLGKILERQYKGLSNSEKTNRYLASISAENSYTVTTAHQPSLLSGPLYYCFKILSIINLAEKLQNDFPNKTIIPVFVIGAEDHDFDEINHFHLFGKKIEWQSEAVGSVGRFPLNGLDSVLEQTAEIIGKNDKLEKLLKDWKKAYAEAKDYAEFSFRLTHSLFDRFGLLILRMDEIEFKTSFKSIIKEEIFNSPSQQLIEECQNKLEQKGYGKQAHAREINLFYHSKAGRKRIVLEDQYYHILDSQEKFTREELESEIENHPENFSPNVVTRPLFQELILPNLAYVGGGGEIAYWMERKTQFAHFNIHFPMLIRRNSAMFVPENQFNQITQLGLELKDFFSDEINIINKYLEQSDQPDYSLNAYESDFDVIYEKINHKIKLIDPTLVKTAKSELVKAKKSLQYLESKLTKSVKQKEEVQINRIKKLKEKLFPNGLQERHSNILEFLSFYNKDLLSEMLPTMDVFDKDFKAFLLSR